MCARTDCKNISCEEGNTTGMGKKHGHPVGEMLAPSSGRADLELKISKDSSDEVLDTLAMIISHQRLALQNFHSKFERFQQSNFYKILFGTTQPAHIISLISVTAVASLSYTVPETKNNLSPSLILVYLAAFSIHCGSQFWMTFISGLSLYFNLPRHAFGSVQKVLFPKYFGLNSFLSAVILISFNKLYHQWDITTIIQEVSLSTCFIVELAIRLYAVPPLLELISNKTNIESSAGVGQEIGYHDPGPLRNCPHYMALHLEFRRVHLYVAIGNIISLACTALHLQFLAQHWIMLAQCH